MKKFTKICLIVCCVCMILGGVLVVAGSAMGANPRQYLGMTGEITEETLDLDDLVEKHFHEKKHREPGHSAPSKTPAEPSPPGAEQYDYDQSFREEVRELELSVNYGEVYLKSYSEDCVRVIADNPGKSLLCKVEGKELRIEDRRDSNQPVLKLTIFLPEKALEDLYLELAAGMLETESLSAREVRVEVNAGECRIGELIVGESADLHAGAGRIQVDRYEGPELDVDCKAGEIEVCLNGGFGDYNYEADVAMGELLLGEKSYSGLGNEQRIHNNAAANVEVECAMGKVCISFADNQV